MMLSDPFLMAAYTVLLQVMRFMGANKKGGLTALCFVHAVLDRRLQSQLCWKLDAGSYRGYRYRQRTKPAEFAEKFSLIRGQLLIFFDFGFQPV
jgi:hypothetical protein